jgi:tRNA(Ile)-lysidine synthetase-like protein
MDVVLPKPGHYVVAVSGGVDSMVLLDILCKSADLKLTVAHLDHGIRDDSAEDRKLVELEAGTRRVPIVCLAAKLGPKTSEAEAREVRYDFLRKVQNDNNADGIITAHHQDDVIETAILNMLRGTGRKGLTSLKSDKYVFRPLLKVPKMQLIKYAKDNEIKWREDKTNLDEKYMRNFVRHNYVAKMNPSERNNLINVIDDMHETNKKLDILLVKHLSDQALDDSIDRAWFSSLPHKVALEFMAAWLRQNGIRNFDSKTLDRLVVAAKTGETGKAFPIISGYNMKVNRDNLALDLQER